MATSTNMVRLASGAKLFSLALAQKQSLWLVDEEYLLIVTCGAYNETSKRLYLADIQSISSSPTQESGIVVLFWAIAAFVLLIPSVLISWMFAPFILIPAVGILRQFYKGGTCTCLFSTSVSVETVIATKYRKDFRKALDRILPIMDRLQGKITEETLETPQNDTASVGQYAEVPAAAYELLNGNSPTETAINPRQAPDITSKPLAKGWYVGLFLMATLAGCMNIMVSLYVASGKIVLSGSATLTLILLLLTIYVFMHQKNHWVHRDLKYLTTGLMVAIAINYFTVFLVGTFVMASLGEVPSAIFYQWSEFFFAFIYLIPGILGLLRLTDKSVFLQQDKENQAL